MTFFEHAMLGGTLALAAGLHRQHGWRIAVMSGVAAMLPDWDGLTLVLGGAAYDRSHRIWGHNLFAASAIGGLWGVIDCQTDFVGRVRRRLSRLTAPVTAQYSDSPASDAAGSRAIVLWLLTGIVASLSHLAVDLLYSSHSRMRNWPLQLLWPFSARHFAFPVIHWGDVGATIVFVIEMFALYRWPTRAQLIACVSLVAVSAYLLLRAITG
jgi:membrane-bound metal-dependent hydrolase YbcI (DUF457 family)